MKKTTTNQLDLKIFATNWGFQGSLTEFCRKAKEEGYDGVEIWTPRKEKDRDKFFATVAKYNLAFGFLAGNWGDNFEQNLKSFESSLESATALKPSFINCHSGKDFYTPTQCEQFFKLTEKYNKSSGIPIYHETHRGRILFAPHIAHQYFKNYADLRVTLDISHWCVVAESLLDNQREAVEMALRRTDHVHSRVGFEEGPQVPEPRAPEWQKAVNAHFAWWDKVVKMKTAANEPLTMTCEFGPPNYLWSLPYTKQPVTNLWEVNAHMMRLWRDRYLS